MATVSETPTLFLRKATGLVKGWSKFDAFVYSFLSVNLVCLGLYFSLSVLPFIPDGQILPSVILTGVFVSFLVITYACLIAVMPRAGGDYVWQSRIFNGGAAFLWPSPAGGSRCGTGRRSTGTSSPSSSSSRSSPRSS